MLVRHSSSRIRISSVHLVAVALFVLIFSGVLLAEERCKIPAMFNFGDSNSDTGSESATFGGVSFPNGITFFGRPSGRYSDGRLLIDFIADKLELPFLSAYLDAIEANFTHGANFAVFGSTIQPVDGKLFGTGLNPLALNLQLLQFQQLKKCAAELQDRATSSIIRSRLPRLEDFSKGLYTFDIGQNDLTAGLLSSTEDQIIDLSDRLAFNLTFSIQNLHRLGGRNFWIHNTGPLGCLPLALKRGAGKKVDEIGCIKSYNEVAQKFNRLLKQKVTDLWSKLQDSVLIYVDIYSAKYSLFREAKENGFVHPFSYCCKNCVQVFTVPYWERQIANNTVDSGTPCDNPSEYITWDGVHFTDAANRWVANKIFDESFTDPSMAIAKLCV